MVCPWKFGLALGLEFWFWPRNFPMWSRYQPRILGILRIPQILRTPATASHSTAGEVHILSNHRARQICALHKILLLGEWYFIFSFFFRLKWPGIMYSGIWGRWSSHLRRRYSFTYYRIPSHFCQKKIIKGPDNPTCQAFMYVIF